MSVYLSVMYSAFAWETFWATLIKCDVDSEIVFAISTILGFLSSSQGILFPEWISDIALMYFLYHRCYSYALNIVTWII